MRFSSTLPLAAVAYAIVVPNVQDVEHWQEFLPSKESIENSVDKVVSSAKEEFDAFASSFEDVVSSVGESFRSAFDDVFPEQDSSDLDVETVLANGGHDHHGKKKPNATIYEAIKSSKHTTKFAALVDEHQSLVDILNSTKANYTLFVPTDAAFEHIPDHHKKPSKEFVEALLKYHVGVGLYPAGRLLATHTLPTALDESWLGGEPQRLRTRVGLFSGIRVNFYSKVIYGDYPATNGLIHAVNHILVPPPMVGRIISLFPGQFSTLLLAYEKTDFVSFIHGVKMEGSTVFAPTNDAFKHLGPAANAFLFNTDKGKKYLKALLKYHIVVNETLYSDAFYQSKSHDAVAGIGGEEDGEAGESGIKHYHVDLPSLLDNKNIAVDISRWAGIIDVKVNGYVHVEIQDGVARNGVIHVVSNVLVPNKAPGHKHEDEEDDGEIVDGEISVEDLVERLSPYVEEEEGESQSQNEWLDL